jgi:hypothetical protein
METVSSKVPSSDKEQIEEYAEEIGESRSVAIRELIRAGLDAKRPSLPLHLYIAWMGSLCLATFLTPSTGSIAAFIAVLGLLGFIGGLSWPYLRSRLPL